MSVRSLNLHIDRIAVDGLSESARKGFPAALERSLRELDAGSLAGTAGASRRRISGLDAGQVPSGATADQAARKVVDGIRRTLSGSIGGGTRGV